MKVHIDIGIVLGLMYLKVLILAEEAKIAITAQVGSGKRSEGAAIGTTGTTLYEKLCNKVIHYLVI